MANDIPAWVNNYIGLPYKSYGKDKSGIDCYNLVRLVYKEQFNIDIPYYKDIGYESRKDSKKIAEFMEKESKKWNKTDIIRPGTVIMFRVMGYPTHVGVAVSDKYMLHIEEGINSVVERYDGLKWKKRIHAAYEYNNCST